MKEQIFPILLKNAKTVKDAKSICQTVMVGLDAVFMEKIKEYQAYLSEDKLNMLKLQTWMNDRKQYPAEWELVELLDQETISCAKTLLQGMEAELTRLTDKQPLETLETEWLWGGVGWSVISGDQLI